MRCGLPRALILFMRVRTCEYKADVVVAAAMFLTVSFDLGFGVENLGERYLVMVPEEEQELRMGRSLEPLTELVKKFNDWKYTKGENGMM